jgi:hypothetical protein
MAIQDYLSRISLASLTGSEAGAVFNEEVMYAAPTPAITGVSTLEAAVNAGSILSFVDGLDTRQKDDVLFSTQFAQRAASAIYNRFTETRKWYESYVEMLENLGWIVEQIAFSHYDEDQGSLRMDSAALKIIAAIATQNQMIVLKEALSALEKLAEDSKEIKLFDFNTAVEFNGNFQIGAVQKTDSGALSVALGAFYFKSVDNKRRFLFFSWGRHTVNFWTAAQKLTLSDCFYSQIRNVVAEKLGEAGKLIAAIPLATQ